MLRNLKDYIAIRKSEFFDAAYYLLNYADIRIADIDPLWHFIEFGWKEGRNPSRLFDTGFYLRMNPDVQKAGINPLVHYLSRGRKEGRSTQPDWMVHEINPESKEESGPGKRMRNYFYKLGKKFYWAIPPKIRQRILFFVFRNLGFLFKGMPRYEIWRNSRAFAQSNAQFHHNLLNIDTIEPADKASGTIAIHFHPKVMLSIL